MAVGGNLNNPPHNLHTIPMDWDYLYKAEAKEETEKEMKVKVSSPLYHKAHSFGVLLGRSMGDIVIEAMSRDERYNKVLSNGSATDSTGDTLGRE